VITPCEGKTAVIVDRFPLWLEAVEEVLHSLCIDAVGKATSTREGLAVVERSTPDLLITEIAMPPWDIDGIEFMRQAKSKVPNLRSIVLSVFEDAGHIDAALGAGAEAYVVKTAHPHDLGAAVRQAFTHSIYLQGTPSLATKENGGAAGPSTRDKSGLTRREIEILRLVAEGYSNAKLAQQLWVTEQTVKFHLSNIYRKLDVSNRTQASRWAQVHGIVSSESIGTSAA
jgi:DNA-binding NarL/FixJ family response regulator